MFAFARSQSPWSRDQQHWYHNNPDSAPEGLTSDSKVHGAKMGPIWGRQDPGGPHVGPMNFAIWDVNPEVLVI